MWVRVLLLMLLAAIPVSGSPLAKATFAGGCFWCLEPPFEKQAGVVSVVSGYTGGRTPDPSYEAVSSGATGHLEAVEVTWDPAKVSYGRLLEIFWRNIDPTNSRGQFCDVGPQYRAAIFVHDAAQQRAAVASKERIEKAKKFTVVTEIVPAQPFYKAEEYHQDYYKKKPVRYRFYRFNCGRDRRLQQVWGD